MRLKNKVAIITGGGRGIGRATAIRFAEEGARVVIADVDKDKAIQVAQEINRVRATSLNGADRRGHTINGEQEATNIKIGNQEQAVALHVNVTDVDSVARMVKNTVEIFGRIDVIVNNAGIVRDAQMLKMDTKDFDTVVSVNLKGVFNCSKAVAPIMVEQGKGVILNASSIVGTYGNFGQTNYAATKAGVVGMTKVWARELGRKGIRVNAVAPGFIQTRLMEGIPDKVLHGIVGRVPQARLGKPEEIANAYLWLASDEASYVNGHVLAVDGGAVI